MKSQLLLLLLLFVGTSLLAQRHSDRVNHELQAGTYLNTVTLGLFHEREDYRLPGLGGGLDFTFYYNSVNDTIDHGYGPGWSFTYDWGYRIDTTVTDTTFVLHRGDGSVDEFPLQGGAWISPVGSSDTLEEVGMSSYRLTTKYGITYDFSDSSHRNLTSITDRNGNATTFGYTDGQPTAVIDPAGRSITLNYTGGYLTELRNTIISPNHLVTYEYDGQDRMVRTTDTEGNSTTYEYDENEGMSGIGSPGGGMFTRKGKGGKTKKTGNQKKKQETAEDDAKKLLKIVEGLDLKQEIIFVRDTCQRITVVKRSCCGELKLEYDGNNNVIKTADADGNTTNHSYDSKGNRLTTTLPNGASDSRTYSSDFNLPTSYTDPLGNTAIFGYDTKGNQTSATYPTHATSTTYNAQGLPTSTTDGKGQSTTYTYNAAGYLTSTTDPAGNTTGYTLDAVGNITGVTDPKGNSVAYTHDTKGNITSFTDAAGNTSNFGYDALGNQTSITDPNGNITEFEYDPFDRKIRETTPGGRTESWAYDAFDNVTTHTDAKGNATTFEYDAANNMIRQTDALGYHTEFEYDSRGNVLSQTQPDGGTITYVYDVLDRRISTTDPLGNTSSRTFDAAGNTSSQTDVGGNNTTFIYDAINRLTSATDPLGNTTTYVFDANSNLVSITDPLGNTQAMTYDALDRRVTTTNPLGGVATYTYDAAGYLTAITDPLGNTASRAYDARGLIVTETSPAGEVTANTYDAVGNLTTVTLPNGRSVTYTLDADYYLTCISDATGTAATFDYDPNGNVVEETNGLGQTILLNEYDALDRVVRQTDAAGLSATFTYDGRDNVVRATTRDGKEQRYVYDERDLLLEEQDNSGNTRAYAHDTKGNITTETDENDKVTTYAYDGLDRRISTTYPDGSSQLITYDAVSNPVAVTSPGGDLLGYTYDAAGNLLLADRPGTNDDSYTYDNGGRLLTATNPVASLALTYDAAGRPLTESLNGKITAYTYDVAANTTTITYPGGRVISHLTDDRGNLKEVREGGSALRSDVYDTADRLTGATFANGATLALVYDPAQRVASLDHASGATLIAGFDHGYSPTGQLIGRDFRHQPDASERYQYDHNNRLARRQTGPVFNGEIPLPASREAFLYDASDNRTLDQMDGDIRSFSSNDLNQYASQTIGGSSTPLSFDGNGHLTDDGSNTYVFDTNNRLVSSGGAVAVSYAYDPLGRRIQQTVGGIETNFYYAGNHLIEERDAADAVTATYVYGTDLDDLVSMQRGGSDYFFHQDVQGSIVAATDASGVIVERYGYQAFGAPSFMAADFSPLPGSAIENPYLFQGRRFDAPTGLYYFRERYYQPDLGWFLSRDPFGAVDGSNLYAFVGNDPANARDPLGTLRYIDKWTPSRQPIKWEEVGIDTKRTKGKTKVKYFKKDCCCIEASCDEFQLTTTTRFRGYQLFFKTNPRWWELFIKVRFLTGSLASDLININELTDILKEGSEESFGLKSLAKDAVGVGLAAAKVNGAGLITSAITGDPPTVSTLTSDYLGAAAGATGGLATGAAAGSFAAAAGPGIALAVGFTIGTKLKQAWTLRGISNEIKEKVKKAEAKARLLKRTIEELGREDPFLRRYDERTRSESRTDRQKENFSAKQVPLSKCK